ncbi:MAG: hypothetical protein HKM04_03950 [Legionellales bacterium]|nr:hypothetical protein [Legionellales bacterium]
MKNVIKEVFISYEENRKIIGGMPYLSEIDNDDTLVASMKICGDYFRQGLNKNTIDEISEFKEEDESTVLIIRGLPLDINIPPTPYLSRYSLQSMPLTVAVNMAIYDTLGLNPVTYYGENEGHLFRHVIPTKKAINEKSSHGSTYTLGMHVDNCHLPLLPEKIRDKYSSCPEYLSLFGVRCDLNVYTKISLLDSALAQLNAETIRQLEQPDFLLRMPDSFEHPQQFELPLLVENTDGIYYSRFDKEYTVPKNEQAKQAFHQLNDALLSTQAVHYFLLQPGDFMIFKNQRVTHCRESFTPRFNGMDRWLLRLFGVSDMNRMVSIDKNRPYYLAA